MRIVYWYPYFIFWLLIFSSILSTENTFSYPFTFPFKPCFGDAIRPERSGLYLCICQSQQSRCCHLGPARKGNPPGQQVERCNGSNWSDSLRGEKSLIKCQQEAPHPPDFPSPPMYLLQNRWVTTRHLPVPGREPLQFHLWFLLLSLLPTLLLATEMQVCPRCHLKFLRRSLYTHSLSVILPTFHCGCPQARPSHFKPFFALWSLILYLQ